MEMNSGQAFIILAGGGVGCKIGPSSFALLVYVACYCGGPSDQSFGLNC